MKKLSVIFFAMFMLTTQVVANSHMGKRFYMQKLASLCREDGISDGGKFARKHSQYEWDELKEENKLIQEWKKICPSATKVFESMRRKDIKNLSDFVWQYASDGELPTCN